VCRWANLADDTRSPSSLYTSLVVHAGGNSEDCGLSSESTEIRPTNGVDDGLDVVNVSASYTLGEGVLLAAFRDHFEYNEGGRTSNDNSRWNGSG
jgi:hypothetical protein